MRDDWLHSILLGIILVILMLFAYSVAWAKPSREEMALLYGIAYSEVGYIPEDNPEIRIVSRESMCQIAAMRQDCNVMGLEVAGHVYIRDDVDLDSVYGRSILLHEFVHAVQYARLGDAPDCEEKLRREREAYAVQIKAMTQAGLDTRALWITMRRLSCV